MKISYGTDVGIVRNENQDSVYVHRFSDTCGLFIVADGMGGYEGGKLASTCAVQNISDYVIAEFEETMSGEQIVEMLQVAIKNTSKKIYEISSGNKELRGMGTTVVACVVSGSTLYTASVGDSRGYVYSGGRLQQITRDHSLVYDMVSKGLISKEEARVHPQKNVITRAVGSEEIVITDTFVTRLNANDIVLICSDGLHTMISDEQITQMLKNDTEDTADRLITLANENGGRDNITVITVKISEEVK